MSGALPGPLLPHATEWYRLCERRFYVDQMTISGELAEAIVQAIATPANSGDGLAFDLPAHLARQRDWSTRTFGPGPRTAGVVDHIRKELVEVEANPTDITEWIDVVILALDGAWRAGFTPEQIVAALVAKQAKNESRVWPDWRTAPQDKAIEHDRSHDTRPPRPSFTGNPESQADVRDFLNVNPDREAEDGGRLG